jgi:hypothetical protein
MGEKTPQSRSGVGIAPSGWRPSLWSRMAPPTETGVVLNRIDRGVQPASYAARVHRAAACAGFLPHRRSRTAHADMTMWLSFLEVTPGRSCQGLIGKKAPALWLCIPGLGRRYAGVADIPQRLRIETFVDFSTVLIPEGLRQHTLWLGEDWPGSRRTTEKRTACLSKDGESAKLG